MRNRDDPVPFALDQERVDLLHRGRIIDAFIAALCERGYPAVTVTDIATRATMSSRTFYRLYDNKDDLFAEVHAGLARRACARMRVAMERHEDPRDKICAALQAVLAYVDEHPEWGRAFVADGPPVHGGDAPLHLATISGWLQDVEDLLPEPGDLTRLEQGAAVCGILRARLADGGGPASQLLPALSQVLLGERIEAVDERPADAVAPEPELTWDALVQALVDHDADALTALQRRAEAALGEGGTDLRPAELVAMAEAAAVGRRGGPAAVLAMLGHAVGDGLPSRQSVRCLRYIAEHPGTSGRGILHGLGFRNESQVSRLLAGLSARGLAVGIRDGGTRSWAVTESGAALLDGLGLSEGSPGDVPDAGKLDPA